MSNLSTVAACASCAWIPVSFEGDICMDCDQDYQDYLEAQWVDQEEAQIEWDNMAEDAAMEAGLFGWDA